jgi:hypothetical protein
VIFLYTSSQQNPKECLGGVAKTKVFCIKKFKSIEGQYSSIKIGVQTNIEIFLSTYKVSKELQRESIFWGKKI